MPRWIERAPLDRQGHFTLEMQVLAQDTKRGLVPRDYVLLLGDSHAKGFGDWLLSADHSGHPPFHSAHVLQERLGRDVLSFGEGGASNVDALVRLPRQLGAALARFGLDPPAWIVVYFYAGNDLQGNTRYLERGVRDGADPARVAERDVLDALLRGQVERDLAWGRAWRSGFFTLRYAGKLAEAIAEGLGRPSGRGDRPEPGRITRARIAGRERWLPDRLQSPALELDAPAWLRALRVLDRSLASLRRLHPTRPILVVYLPAPLSCYQITSPSVGIAAAGGGLEIHPTERLERRSLATRRRVAEIAAGHGLDFLDVTPRLRELASREPVHGPRDWLHPNERGYRAIGRAVAERLPAAVAGSRPPGPFRLQ